MKNFKSTRIISIILVICLSATVYLCNNKSNCNVCYAMEQNNKNEITNVTYNQTSNLSLMSNSNVVPLFTPVNEIEDGAVYFIRNANNTNLVWDMPNANTSVGTTPILYGSTGWGNQRFIVRKEALYNNEMYYTIVPLYAPDKTLRLDSNNENELISLGYDKNTSLENFLSNKFIIQQVPGTTKFVIKSGVSTFGKYIIPTNDNVASGNTLSQKTTSIALTNPKYQWEFLKTDTLGLDLKNQVYINGTNTLYFNLTPPSTGKYIIETFDNNNDDLDTYLELYDNNGTLLSYNDDGTNNYHAKIIYDFSSTDDCSIRLRGYDDEDDFGYTYLIFRPEKELFFSAVYDFNKNNNDRPGSLEATKQQLPGYYVNIQANQGKAAALEIAANGKTKMNSEYYVFSGHGYSNVAGVEFYNSVESEGFSWYEIPNMNGTKIAIWMTCHGARNYFKNGSSGEMTSMAFRTIEQGADYSLGYVGTIYDTTQRMFPSKFFEALNTNQGISIEQAIATATQWTINNNWWWWTFFGSANDDFKNPIIYKKNDTLRLTCGNGIYTDDKKTTSNVLLNINEAGLYKNGYIVNTNEPISTTITYNKSSLENEIPYKFITKYENSIIKLGFIPDENTRTTKYYNLSEGKEITSTEFEIKMGSATQNILHALKK